MSELLTGVDEYKFLCFGGEPRYVYHSDNHFSSIDGRRKECSVSHFSLDWENWGVQYGCHENKIDARPPKFMNEMLEIAKVLSEGFSFVGVDFFETERSFFLSELTFTQGGGLTKYYPESFDYELGKCWNLDFTL